MAQRAPSEMNNTVRKQILRHKIFDILENNATQTR